MREIAPTLEGRKWKRIEDYSAFKSEIEIPEINIIPFDPLKEPDPDFSLSVFIRMLYSCLVDADFLDTEKFMKNGQTHRDSGEDVDVLLERLKDHVADWLLNEDTDTVNGRRTRNIKALFRKRTKRKRNISAYCSDRRRQNDRRLWHLRFSMRWRIIWIVVIYVIPYTSIIEQNAEVFRRILGDQNVLENHYNVDYESSEELRPMQLASENWDKPVVGDDECTIF